LKTEAASVTQTNRTTASKLAERKKMDMVKTLIKRQDGNDDNKSVGSNRSKRSKSSNVLLQKMNERLKEEGGNYQDAEKVSNSNPLLKKLVNENKMDK